jgi:hypothetical protein
MDGKSVRMRLCPSCLREYAMQVRYQRCPHCLCYAPDAREIRRSCQRIQRTWSKADEQKRSNYKRVHVMTKLAEMIICTRE